MPRSFLLAAVGLALAGCNLVVTDAPLFKAEAGAPVIRPGVWRADVPGCEVDESLPQSKWPACADATPAFAQSTPWTLVSGDPDILQLPLRINPRQAAPIVAYAAFRPLKFDRSHRIISLKVWLVQCGPPSSPGEMKGLTKQLLPGLRARPDIEGCTATDAGVLRAAARASEAWAQPPMTSHWAREKIAGDLDATPNLVAGPPAKP
jgi:hypothetical protein